MNERQQEIASAVLANLDDLPRLRGFRLRGMEMPVHSPPPRGGLTIYPPASPHGVFSASVDMTKSAQWPVAAGKLYVEKDRGMGKAEAKN